MPHLIDINKSKQDSKEQVIFVLGFSFTSAIETAKFCDEFQEVMYDEQGSTGHFRMAPKYAENLNADFIEFAGKQAHIDDYYDRNPNEIIAAFIIRETDPDVSLNEELGIFPKELSVFLERTGSTVSQLDIATMY